VVAFLSMAAVSVTPLCIDVDANPGKVAACQNRSCGRVGRTQE